MDRIVCMGRGKGDVCGWGEICKGRGDEELSFMVEVNNEGIHGEGGKRAMWENTLKAKGVCMRRRGEYVHGEEHIDGGEA